MSDLISRQYLLDEYDRQHQGPPGGARKIIEEAPAVEVFNYHVSCSEFLNSSDLISRQAAIDACMKYNGRGYVWTCIMGDIRNLPSLQPDRCADCRFTFYAKSKEDQDGILE